MLAGERIVPVAGRVVSGDRNMAGRSMLLWELRAGNAREQSPHRSAASSLL
jgi:hypothetical protein